MVRLSRLLQHPIIAGFLFLLPLLVFAVYFSLYSTNIPWFDDFESIPYFLHRFLDAPTWGEKWQALLRPNNEHRVVYARLVVWVYYLLTGVISFRGLMVVGNLALLVLLYLFYRTLRRAGLPGWYLLPIPFLLFHPQNQLLTFTALYTLQYLAIIMLVSISLYQLARNTGVGFGLALLVGLFGTFSMGNGMLVWAAGIVVLFYQKQWLRMGGWAVVAVVAVYLYFHGYPVQQGNTEGFAYLLEHPLQIVSGFLIYTGSVFDPTPFWPLSWRVVVPFLAGAAMLTFLAIWGIRLLFLTKKAPTHYNAFLLGCVVFLIINTAIVALFRIRFNFGMVLWSTYRTYIMVLTAVVYLILVGSVGAGSRGTETVRRWLVPGALLLAMGVNVVAYTLYLPSVVEYRNNLRAQAFNQRYSQIGLGGERNSALAAYIEENLAEMKKRTEYELPDPCLAVGEEDLLKPVAAPARPANWTLAEDPEYVTVQGRDETYPEGRNGGIYLVIKSDRQTYLRYGKPVRPSERNPLLITTGFQATIPKRMVLPGRYQLGAYVVFSNGQTQLTYTNQFITVE